MPADSAVAPAPTTPPATPPAGAAALPPGVTPEMVAAGQQTFSTVCVACHGPDATGTPLAPNLTDNVWLNISGRNYDEIVNLIKTGVNPPKEAPAPMMPLGGAQLTDQQLRDMFEVAQFAKRDRASVDDWVRVFKQKRDEIASARCANPVL